MLSDDFHGFEEPREDAVARVRDAGHVQSRDLALAAHLHHMQLADDGVPFDGLVKPEKPVGHREHGVVVLAVGILPDEEGRGLAAREGQREALHEVGQPQLAARPGVERASHEGAKGVHDDDARIRRLDLEHDCFQHLRHPSCERRLAEVDEPHRAVAHFGGVEEFVLLLIAKHLDRRFADDAEIHGPPLGARVREHDLMRHRRLAAPWAAGDQIERKFRNPAAQDFVKPRHPGGQLTNLDPVTHWFGFLGAVFSIVGQAARSTWAVRRSPIKVVISEKKVPNSAAADSVAKTGS